MSWSLHFRETVTSHKIIDTFLWKNGNTSVNQGGTLESNKTVCIFVGPDNEQDNRCFFQNYETSSKITVVFSVSKKINEVITTFFNDDTHR
jgi:hypothetical protein